MSGEAVDLTSRARREAERGAAALKPIRRAFKKAAAVFVAPRHLKTIIWTTIDWLRFWQRNSKVDIIDHNPLVVPHRRLW